MKQTLNIGYLVAIGTAVIVPKKQFGRQNPRDPKDPKRERNHGIDASVDSMNDRS